MSAATAMRPEDDRPIRVLLLEDSPLDAELIARQLGGAGMAFDLRRVWTREDFLDELQQARADVILADHVLPQFDGDSALLLARERSPQVPFIFVSGTLTEELAVRALKRGATDYVVKQRLQRLPEAVQRAVSESRERSRLRAAEQALQASRRQLQTITDALPALIAFVDREQRYRFTNKAYETWFGRPVAALQGAHVREVLGEAAYARMRPYLERGLAGETLSFESTLPSAAGERHLQIAYVPERDADGRVAGLYAMGTDISDRRAAELALRQLNETLERQVDERTGALRRSEARLRAVFESSFQSQVVLEPDGTVVDANATWLAAILAARADVIGRPFWDSPWFAATAGMGERLRRMVAEAAGGQVAREELTLQLPTGRRSFDYSVRPVRDHEGAIAAVLAEAVETTDRRHAEEALRQSQKMEAVGQLTGGIAHDFNNLLTVVAGNIEIAQRRIGEGTVDPRIRRALDNAGKGATRAAALTQRLLAFSRRQPLQPRSVQLNRLLRDMTPLLRGSLGETIDLRHELASDLWPVAVDPNQLEAALLNLAVNARDAMPRGGQLVLETANVQVDPHGTHPYANLAPGSYVVMAVTDTGCGMSAETLAHAFEPFFTTKEVGRGTGLGLSMVYGFVQQSGGHVQIHSLVGQGTSVKLFLPRLDVREAPAEQVPEPKPLGGSKRETVLVAEDDADVRAYTVACLQELGYRVLEAADGPSALRLLEQHAQPVDLLFTDVVMPAMSGRELADTAQARNARLKVLYTSGYTRDAIATHGQLGDTDLIRKPFTYAALGARVAAALQGGRTGDG